MPTLNVTNRAGSTRTVTVAGGVSLMEALRGAGFDEILALCGGNCVCATCHVHIDADWFERMPEFGEDEDDMLDGSDHRKATSRLACQIPLTEEMDGLTLCIADED